MAVSNYPPILFYFTPDDDLFIYVKQFENFTLTVVCFYVSGIFLLGVKLFSVNESTGNNSSNLSPTSTNL